MNTKEIAIKFYDAFASADVETLKKLYDEKLIFNDEIFVGLSYEETIKMWSSLLIGNKDMSIKYTIKEYSENKVKVEWIADYLFSASRRKVRNVIIANMEIENGKIIKHTDEFNFYKWSKMALGTLGLLLVWTSFFRNKVRKGAYEKLGFNK